MNKFFFILLVVFSCATIPEKNTQINKYKINYQVLDWKQLSLREKIAQMIMIRVRGDYYHNQHSYRQSLKRWLSIDGIGGIITFGGSIHGSFYNIKKFQDWAKFPLLVAADYERGLGQWMKGGTLFPSNMAIAATNDTSLAYEQGRITAIEAKALGVHITFSPVMDINNNPENPIINFRSYGDSPEIVSRFGKAFIKGVQDNGLIACAKHFPGHGNTSTDSHTSLPTINGSRSKLDSLELYPFQNAIKAGVKMIMVGHIALPGLDSTEVPSTHSNLITTKILKNEMGFEGLVITDGMEMGGLTKSAWAGESAIRAVEAGADILLLPLDINKTIDAIEEAVIMGRISENRINSSIEKIWKIKNDMGVLNGNNQITFENLEKNIGIINHTRKAIEMANKSITLVKDNNQLPLLPEKIDSIAHIILSLDDGARGYLKLLSQDIKRTHNGVREVFVNDKISQLRQKDIINQMKNMDQIIVSLLVRIRMDKGIATIDSTHNLLIEKLHKIKIPIITLSFGSPYLPDYDFIDTYICGYGYGQVTVKSMSNVIWGRNNITGVLPVSLNKNYKQGLGLKKKERNEGWNSKLTVNLESAIAIIDGAIEKKVFPGAQITIIKNNELLLNEGYGFQTYDSSSTQITRNTIFDIASLTKVLATVPIVIKLIERKKLSLNQELHQFFPNIIGFDKKGITIRHLLTHSAGFKSYIPFYKNKFINTEEEIVKSIIESELEYEPGTRILYSDLGFILLSSIINKIAGKQIDKLSYEWYYKSLGMNSTQFNPSLSLMNQIAPTEIDNLYRKRLVHAEVHDENAFLMGGVSGHAGLFSNSMDIAKYGQLWLNKGLSNGKRIIQADQIIKFTQKDSLNGKEYTLGWDIPSKNQDSSAGDYFSSGSIGHLGFTGCSLWIDIKRNIIVVLLTNRIHPSREGKGIYHIRREFHNKVMAELIKD